MPHKNIVVLKYGFKNNVSNSQDTIKSSMLGYEKEFSFPCTLETASDLRVSKKNSTYSSFKNLGIDILFFTRHCLLHSQ